MTPDNDRPPTPIHALGAHFLGGLTYFGSVALLMGDILRWLMKGMFSRQARFDSSALTAQMVRVGVKSTSIVMLVQLFIGVILALQLTPPLAQWSQEAQVSRIIGLGGFRMLGPIITAVVLSGFAGASIAAELGTMAVSEEIEALEAAAINPVRFLAVPRVMATTVMTILLTVLADLCIAAGGYVTSLLVLGPTSYEGYWARMQEQLRFQDFFTGLTQSGVFGLLVGLIACHEGLSTTGGAEGVGKATTRTVVLSIVAIIAAACVFTVVFYVWEK